MIRRFVVRALDAQTGWARPLGGWIQGLLKAIFSSARFLKDFLNGTWLGHSVHAMVTDVPVGAFTLAIVLDVFDLRTAADVAIAVGLVTMLGAALAGWADYTDTDLKPRDYATVHQVLMLVSLVLYAASLWLRLESLTLDRTAPIWLSVAGYLVLAVGAYVGGEVVYGMGNMVNRHAFRSFGKKWQPLDVDAEEGKPVKAKAGAQTLVVVKRGDRLYALHDVCAHAACSLSEGKIVGDAIECDCHGSRYRLSDGRVLRGPATFDQPAFEVRKSSDGKLEARRAGTDE